MNLPLTSRSTRSQQQVPALESHSTSALCISLSLLKFAFTWDASTSARRPQAQQQLLAGTASFPRAPPSAELRSAPLLGPPHQPAPSAAGPQIAPARPPTAAQSRRESWRREAGRAAGRAPDARPYGAAPVPACALSPAGLALRNMSLVAEAFMNQLAGEGRAGGRWGGCRPGVAAGDRGCVRPRLAGRRGQPPAGRGGPRPPPQPAISRWAPRSRCPCCGRSLRDLSEARERPEESRPTGRPCKDCSGSRLSAAPCRALLRTRWSRGAAATAPRQVPAAMAQRTPAGGHHGRCSLNEPAAPSCARRHLHFDFITFLHKCCVSCVAVVKLSSTAVHHLLLWFAPAGPHAPNVSLVINQGDVHNQHFLSEVLSRNKHAPQLASG